MASETFVMTLGQLLKHENYVSSGGEVKHRIHEFSILVNGEPDNRRGRKLYVGDIIEIDGQIYELTEDLWKLIILN